MTDSLPSSAAEGGTGSIARLAGERFDVVIAGGGLAGLTLALQIRRELPEQSVLVVDKLARPLPESAFKVGESSVEMGSQYLERLGLREYLERDHIFKFGLRFFAGGGDRPLDERPEIGPAQEPIVPSYQLDRGRLETDLRRFVEEAGATLVEGASVRDVELSPEAGDAEADHRVVVSTGDEKATVSARWFVDATGRASLLRKRLKLTRGTKYVANAGWFRIRGKLDITEMVPADHAEWHDVEWAPHRWRSTNHLMGPGYWAWVIPLSTGNTSIGLVGHDEHVPFEAVRSLENTLDFLKQNEPHLAKTLESFEIMDFRCLKNYSYNVARGWSAERWALVGEAGAFADPLYSPGTDFIGLANSFTVEMIHEDLAKGDLVSRARELSAIYRSMIGGAVDLYREAAQVYAHAPALLAKIYWDNLVYWSYPCQVFQQNMFKLRGDEMLKMMPMGERFVDLTLRMQKLFAAWAELAPVSADDPAAKGFYGMPGFPSILIDAHLALQDTLTPDETRAYMRKRLTEAEVIAGEMLLRAIDEVGPDKLDEFLARVEFESWGLTIADERIAATETVGLGRRRALSRLARDVERTLGRTPHNVGEAQLRSALAAVIAKPEVPVDVVPEAGANAQSVGG